MRLDFRELEVMERAKAVVRGDFRGPAVMRPLGCLVTATSRKSPVQSSRMRLITSRTRNSRGWVLVP